MIPAEARNIVDNLHNIKFDRNIILDAVECLSRTRPHTMRDTARIERANQHLKEQEPNV